MLGSRVCWQLLLGWALLLGQPVFGDSDATKEPPLPESEDPVPVPQEPEDPVPVPEELGEPVPEAEEPEEPVSGEPVDSKEMFGRPLTSEEIQTLFGPSNEELESRAKQFRQWLENDRDGPSGSLIDHLKHIVLQHHNQKSNYFYMPYENGNVKVKKAIGTMIYVTLLLVKTSCTKEEGEAVMRQRYYDVDEDDEEMVDNPLATGRKRCEVPPASEQEVSSKQVLPLLGLQEDSRTRILSSLSGEGSFPTSFCSSLCRPRLGPCGPT